MNLHPEISKLLAEFSDKQFISIEEKQRILNRAIELNEDLTLLVSELEKIELTAINNSVDKSKCKLCGELIPALDRVCPSCKNVKSTAVDIKLDELIFESENLLTKLKSSDSISFSKRLLGNSSISFPVFIGASFVLGFNFNSNALAGVFFCSLLLWLLAIRRIKRRFIQNQNEQNHSSFQQLDSQLENKISLLELYFGNDSRTRNHITQLKQELLKLTTRKKQLVLFEVLIYIISLLTLIVIGYFTQI
jgi:hypothetical protein